MAKPSGEIIETPITANFREGLTVLEYFISTHGARKGLADTALKTANSGYLTRRLVDVANDCTSWSSTTAARSTASTPRRSMRAARSSSRSRTGSSGAWRSSRSGIRTTNLLVEANDAIDEVKAEAIEEAGIERVRIRSGLTCQTLDGVCALCYGRDLSRGRLVNVGEAVGTIAAQSIGEPGTQLTMRTFHIGGVAPARRAVQPRGAPRRHGPLPRHQERRKAGRRAHRLDRHDRNGEVSIHDEQGRERERYPLVYGSNLYYGRRRPIEQGEILAEWEPFATPVLTDQKGYVQVRRHRGGLLHGGALRREHGPVA